MLEHCLACLGPNPPKEILQVNEKRWPFVHLGLRLYRASVIADLIADKLKVK